MSILRSAKSRSRPDDDDDDNNDDVVTEEARLDAMATEILKSNGRPHICVPLQPLLPGLAQFIYETSRDCDFMETLVSEQPGLDTEELYNRYGGSLESRSRGFGVNNQQTSTSSVLKRAAETTEQPQQTLPGEVASAAPGDFDPHGSGELLLGPVLLQPEEQHEGTGGSVGCGGCRVAAATLRLLQVGETLLFHTYRIFSSS